MNKYNNPRLLNAVVSGTGMKHPVQPHVVVGDESNGFIRGDLMDANAIVDLVNSILHPKEEDSYNYNGHEYVDLGLPSGTKWAKMNVGATSETDNGLYFAWGETEGYTASQVGTGEGQKAFSWSDYKYGTESNLTKYNATDNLTHLELTDDAAHVNMGGDWHMPNRAQYIELLKETKNGFVTDDGVFAQYIWSDNDSLSNFTMESPMVTISGWNTAGYIFFKMDVSDMDAAITSGDYLFVPAAGSCAGGEVGNVGNMGYVWTSALNSVNAEIAGYFLPSHSRAYVSTDDGDRYYGQSVRGVIGLMNEIEDDNTTPGEEEGPIK